MYTSYPVLYLFMFLYPYFMLIFLCFLLLLYITSKFMYRFTLCFFFFVKQKTEYEMLISDWSSDVCSSDLLDPGSILPAPRQMDPGSNTDRQRGCGGPLLQLQNHRIDRQAIALRGVDAFHHPRLFGAQDIFHLHRLDRRERLAEFDRIALPDVQRDEQAGHRADQELRQIGRDLFRSEEHTSELQSLMRISYAVFCLNKKT